MIKIGAILAAAGFLAMSGLAAPDVKVEVKGLHLCCNGCNNAATGAINGAGGKEAAASRASMTARRVGSARTLSLSAQAAGSASFTAAS